MDISLLKGMTLLSAVVNKSADPADKADEVIFTTIDKRRFRLYHNQDCCEHVYIEDLCGYLTDLIGSPILQAEEITNEKGRKLQSGDESFTWTFYRLATMKGQVVIRWYGSSNGYYSERVDFEEMTPLVIDKPKKQNKKPKKQPKYFNLPDGKATQSVRLYLKEWNKILKPLEKLTGLKVYGFDPSITLIKLEKGVPVQGTTVNMPVWFAKILTSKFESLNDALNDYKDRGIIH